MIPGLERAEFLRFGQVHRNTTSTDRPCWRRLYNCASAGNVFFAGADFGVEGYVGVDRDGSGGGFGSIRPLLGETVRTFPRSTAIGSCVLTLREPIRRNLPAGEYHLRLVAELGASAERQKGAAGGGVPQGLAARMSSDTQLSELHEAIDRYLIELRIGKFLRILCGTMLRIWGSSKAISLRRRVPRPRLRL